MLSVHAHCSASMPKALPVLCCWHAGASQSLYDTATANKIILAALGALVDPSIIAAANDGSLYTVCTTVQDMHMMCSMCAGELHMIAHTLLHCMSRPGCSFEGPAALTASESSV